jgi:hypothetical protein
MPGNVARLGGHAESLRRRCGDAAGVELGTDPVDRNIVNVGTLPGRPYFRWTTAAGGQADRQLMAGVGGGAFVVVRGRESRPHGEGRQRDRSRGIGMLGGRR